IPGQPQGKARARSRIIKSKRTGQQFVSHYTPADTRRNELTIRTLAVAAMRGRPPMPGPVRLELLIAFEVPKSWPKWKTEMALAGQIAPTVKPDSDNVEKSVKDALNGVAWVDDCQ